MKKKEESRESLQLTRQDLNNIYNLAHKYFVDNPVNNQYPISNVWLKCLIEYMEGRGYEIIAISDGISYNIELPPATHNTK